MKNRSCHSPILSLALASSWALLSSCTGPRPGDAGQPPSPTWSWTGDGVQGRPLIIINLSAQRIQYFKGGRLVGDSPISSGREGCHTRTGSYRITEKDIDHRSSLYGTYVDAGGRVVVEDVDCRCDPRPSGTRFLGASMRYFMRITGGIGMHEGYLPGFPASHGCIRLPTEMARIFYQATPLGTPVRIVGDASVAVNQAAVPLAPDEPIISLAQNNSSTPPRSIKVKPPKEKKDKEKPAWKPKRSRAPKPAPLPRGTTLYLEGYG